MLLVVQSVMFATDVCRSKSRSRCFCIGDMLSQGRLSGFIFRQLGSGVGTGLDTAWNPGTMLAPSPQKTNGC